MPTRHAHTLLFACPNCQLPLAITRMSKDKNCDDVDAELLRLKCSFCGKSSDVRAVTAKRHYVEDWPF
jgi:hypothetical protein